MRMNCDRPTYAYLPFEILYLVPDNFGKWGDNWKVHSKHNSKAERDRAFDLLTETPHRRYRKAVNDYEYDAMIAAEYRYEQAHKKPDDTDIAGALANPSVAGSFKESTGVDPDDGVVTFAGGAFHVCDFDIPNVMVEAGKIRSDRYAVSNGIYPPSPHWIEL